MQYHNHHVVAFAHVPLHRLFGQLLVLDVRPKSATHTASDHRQRGRWRCRRIGDVLIVEHRRHLLLLLLLLEGLLLLLLLVLLVQALLRRRRRRSRRRRRTADGRHRAAGGAGQPRQQGAELGRRRWWRMGEAGQAVLVGHVAGGNGGGCLCAQSGSYADLFTFGTRTRRRRRCGTSFMNAAHSHTNTRHYTRECDAFVSQNTAFTLARAARVSVRTLYFPSLSARS